MQYKGYTLKEEYHDNCGDLHVVIERPDGSELRYNANQWDADFHEVVDEDIWNCEQDAENERRREAIANGMHPNFL